MLAACGGDDAPDEESPPPPAAPSQEWIKRYWRYHVMEWKGSLTPLGDSGSKFGTGIVDDERIVGGLLVKPDNVPDGARMQVYSSEDGVTYWVGTQVPAARPTIRLASTFYGLNSINISISSRRKTTRCLSFTVSQALVELMDRNPDFKPRPITDLECPERSDTERDCASVVWGAASPGGRAYNYDTSQDFFQRSSRRAVGRSAAGLGADAVSLSAEDLWNSRNLL